MSNVATISTPASPEKRDKVRKRVDSIGEEGREKESPPSKKPRMGDERIPASPGLPSTSASISTNSSSTSRGDVSSQASSFTQMSSSVPSPRLRLDLDKLPPKYVVPLSRRSSMNSISRAQSPLVRTPSTGFHDSDPWPSDILRSRIVRRNASSASLRSMSPGPAATPISEPVYAPESARNFMRNPKFVVDYSQPSVVRPQPPAAAEATEGEAQGASGNEVQTGPAAADTAVARNVPAILPPPGFIPPPPPPVPERNPREMLASVRPRILGCSATGILFFTRANRLHSKNLSANEEVGQICRVQESHGTVTAIACGVSSTDAASGNHGVVALGTSKGLVSIYDVQTKKRVVSWIAKPVASLAWNNKILTVGCVSGSICHFDTRITPVEKMKEQALTVTRHQAPITCMEWNADGDVLASADKKGNVYCWKSGDKVPLDIGEFVMRRKKIKHTAAISASAVSWCPWQQKNLLTADVKGVIQFWTVDPKCKDSNAMTPARLDTGSAITGVHWSTQCKEFLTTHGYKVPKNLAAPPPPPPPVSTGPLYPAPPPAAPEVENTLAVWQFPSLRFVTKMQMNTTDVPIGNSVSHSKGMKLVFAVPDQGKIHTCDVWGKRKPELNKIRRQSSLDYVGIIR